MRKRSIVCLLLSALLTAGMLSACSEGTVSEFADLPAGIHTHADADSSEAESGNKSEDGMQASPVSGTELADPAAGLPGEVPEGYGSDSSEVPEDADFSSQAEDPADPGVFEPSEVNVADSVAEPEKRADAAAPETDAVSGDETAAVSDETVVPETDVTGTKTAETDKKSGETGTKASETASETESSHSGSATAQTPRKNSRRKTETTPSEPTAPVEASAPAETPAPTESPAQPTEPANENVCTPGHHVYPDTWKIVRQPSCTQAGSKSRTCQCGQCAQSMAFGKPTGIHNYVHKETAATCVTNGSRYDICTSCNAKINVEVIPALGHNYVKHETAATCSSEGSSYEECTNCHKVINRVTLPKKAHTWGETITVGEQTCTTSSYDYRICQVCGAESEKCYHPSTGGHKYVIDGTRSTYGTCTEAGTIVEVCSVCGAVNYREDPAFGFHQWVEQSRVNGTCQHEGSIEYECSLCHARKTETTPKTDHRWVLNDNRIGLKECADCGLQFSEDLYPDTEFND